MHACRSGFGWDGVLGVCLFAGLATCSVEVSIVLVEAVEGATRRKSIRVELMREWTSVSADGWDGSCTRRERYVSSLEVGGIAW